MRRAGWMAVAVGALATLGGAFLLGAGPLARGVVAAGLIAMVVGATLAGPWRRWSDRTVAERWAAARSLLVAGVVGLAGGAVVVTAGVAVAGVWLTDGAVVLERFGQLLHEGSWTGAVVVMSVPLAWASRSLTAPELGRWLRLRGLPESAGAEAHAWVRRTRILRTLPAVIGAAVAHGPAVAYNLVVGPAGADTPVAQALQQAASGEGWPNPVVAALVGYLVGIVLGETLRPTSSEGGRSARLDTRHRAAYLSEVARWLPVGLAAALVVVVALNLLILPAPETPALVAAVAVAAGGLLAPAAHRWVVSRPQRISIAHLRALDDVLRSSTAHALTGGASALVLLTVMTWASQLVALAGRGGAVGVVESVLGMLGGVAVLGLWFGYGSSYAWRPTVGGGQRP